MKDKVNNGEQAGPEKAGSQDDFLSLQEIVGMILRHCRAIAVIVILVTAAAAAYFTLAPRQFKAEGFLRVIPPVTSIDEKVDQAAFETIIISHLQAIQAAFIAGETAQQLGAMPAWAGKPAINPVDLQKKIKVIRPPKSYLITVEGACAKPDMALALVKAWIDTYLATIRKNNINIALCHVRALMKKSQSDLVENQAKVDHLVSRTGQIKSLVDLSRGIKDTELWRELSANTPPDKLNNLSKIHISDQEQSEDYLELKKALYEVDKDFAAAKAGTEFFRKVAEYLEQKTSPAAKQPSGAPPDPDAIDFAETLVNTTDIIQIGQPALKNTSGSAARNTLMVFFASLGAAALVAFLREWVKTIEM